MTLLSDVQREGDRIAKAETLDLQAELANTVMPLLESIVEFMQSEFTDVGEVLSELSDDPIDDELAAQTITTLRLGVEIMEEMIPEDKIDWKSDFGQRLQTYMLSAAGITNALEEEILDELDEIPKTPEVPSDEELDELEKLEEEATSGTE